MALSVSSALALTGSTFTNPVIWEDLADLDIFRVNDTYYYSASTMAYSPGAPILKSGDLVNWEYIGHSVPTLDFNDPTAYSLENGQQAYVRGIWASSMRYRPSNKMWYWIGCVDFKQSYIYTASEPTGKWSLASTIDTCYYDCGLLFDDDDSIYVAYGNTDISIAKLNNDLTQESTTPIFKSSFNIEGSRLYKVNGTYYVLNTQPTSWEWTLKSDNGIYGPYTQKVLSNQSAPPTPGAGHPHQGGIVDTPEGDWYYMAFIDDYPGGRCPVLAPIYFDSEGWPTLYSPTEGFTIPEKYPQSKVPVPPLTGTDSFLGPSLSPQWEWNHNPDTTKYSFAKGGGLVLDTATVTNDLHHARNTLTHRILGPNSTATIELDISKMKAGDRAGLSLFRDNSAYISVQDGSIALWNNVTLGAGWNTLSTGYKEGSVSLAPPKNGKKTSNVWFRLHADIAPLSDKLGTFSYSTDGLTFHQLGAPYLMNTTYYYFIGYRYGIFNFATETLGGSVTVNSFTQTFP